MLKYQSIYLCLKINKKTSVDLFDLLIFICKNFYVNFKGDIKMALEARLNELKSKHKEMASKIEKEVKFASADPLKINDLKREKMKLKDQIYQVESQMAG